MIYQNKLKNSGCERIVAIIIVSLHQEKLWFSEVSDHMLWNKGWEQDGAYRMEGRAWANL